MTKRLIFGFVLLLFLFCLMDNSSAAKSRDMDKTLAKNSKRLHDWVNSTNVSHFTSFFLFNVTGNTEPDTEKPVILAEVGPFKFRQEREIKVIGFEDFVDAPTDQDLLVVSIRKFYHFIDDQDVDLDQKITVLNTPLQMLYFAVNKFRMTKRPLYNQLNSTVNKEILNKLPLYVTRTVRELLFGYSDETIEQIAKVREVFEQFGLELQMDEYIRDGKFSVVNSRNGSSTEPLTVKTGAIYYDWDYKTKADLSLVGQLEEIGVGAMRIDPETDKPKNPAWDEKPCNKVNGTVPGIHSPNPNETITVYETEMERWIKLNEVPSEKSINGDAVRKFVWWKKNFGKWTPANLENGNCPCVSSMSRFHFTLNEPNGGVQRKSGYRYNTPTVYSLPHYLDAERHREMFEGLKPNRSLHETFIEVANATGEQIYERKNLQINIDTSGSTLPRDIWPAFEQFFPLFWFSEESIAGNAH